MKKIYLNVTYQDRNLAKRLGARWDPAVKRWYCLADSPLSKIFSWRKETRIKAQTLSQASVNRTSATPSPTPQNFELPLSH